MQPLRPAFAILPLSAAALLLTGCPGADPGAELCEGIDGPCRGFVAGVSTQDDVRAAFIDAETGSTLVFGAGTFSFSQTLNLDATGVTVRGQGMDATDLEFSASTTGHGLFVTGDDFTIEDLSIWDAAENGIEVRDTDGITFRRIRAGWTAEPNPETTTPGQGRYAVYPVMCKNLLVEGSEAYRATDAGLYVGSCENIVIRDSYAAENVSGFQIENSHYADFYDNLAENNTMGLLVHDLPGLEIKNGSHTRVFDNEIVDNNHFNFSLATDMTFHIPVGTGLIVLAREGVRIFENTITGHQTTNVAIASYFVIDGFDDTAYDPYPRDVYIHDNTISGGGNQPDITKVIGNTLEGMREDLPGERIPDIIYDGLLPSEHREGTDPNPVHICLGNNGGATFMSLGVTDEESFDMNPSLETTGFECERPALDPTTVPQLD
jgi:parallel beta-helix repeat protein